MKASHRLQKRLAVIEKLLSRSVDCALESKNNVERCEWDFAATNLRNLFFNAAAIKRQRATVLRALCLARKESER